MRYSNDLFLASALVATSIGSFYYEIWFISVLSTGILLSVILTKSYFHFWLTPEKIMEKHRKKAKNSTTLVKKYEEADTRRFFGLFLRTGMMIALLAVIFAFKMNGNLKALEVPESTETDIDIKYITPIPEWEPPKPKTKPEKVIKDQTPKDLDKVKIVDNDKLIEELKKETPLPVDKEKIRIPDGIAIDDEEEEDTKEEFIMPKPIIVNNAEFMPTFKVCADIEDKTERQKCTDQHFLAHFANNINYPPLAAEVGIEGPVYISFLIDENGKVKDAKLQGKGIGGGCEQEALRVLNLLPTLEPGKQNGRSVIVQHSMPVKFILE